VCVTGMARSCHDRERTGAWGVRLVVPRTPRAQ
jgi:hypothetical protein